MPNAAINRDLAALVLAYLEGGPPLWRDWLADHGDAAWLRLRDQAALIWCDLRKVHKKGRSWNLKHESSRNAVRRLIDKAIERPSKDTQSRRALIAVCKETLGEV